MAVDPRKVGDEATVAAIANVQQKWLDAVKVADVERLLAMVTDDIVVVHGNGRCLRGKDELRADFLRGFEVFSIHQSASPVEAVVQGRWVFEISEIDTKLTPHSGGESKHIHSTTVTALHQQPDESWKISRVLGLLD